mmetsp:Transcript_25470/g.37627  ORF Transcript_25470/g.37627 Transcript_25470/m.37627 type:complete len:136 (-) Transcript_25470:126-533(-)
MSALLVAPLLHWLAKTPPSGLMCQATDTYTITVESAPTPAPVNRIPVPTGSTPVPTPVPTLVPPTDQTTVPPTPGPPVSVPPANPPTDQPTLPPVDPTPAPVPTEGPIAPSTPSQCNPSFWQSYDRYQQQTNLFT